MYTHRDEEFPQARNMSTWTQLEGSSSSQHVSLPVYDGFVGVAPAKSSTRERAASGAGADWQSLAPRGQVATAETSAEAAAPRASTSVPPLQLQQRARARSGTRVVVRHAKQAVGRGAQSPRLIAERI